MILCLDSNTSTYLANSHSSEVGRAIGRQDQLPPLSQVLLVLLQGPLDVALTLHLNEGLASRKAAVVQTEIDACIT